MRVFGDIAGVQIAKVLAAGLRQAQVAGRNLAETAAEYVTEESRDVVPRAELDAFFAVKRAFDPHTLLNPDKAIPTLNRCAEFGKMHVTAGRLPFANLPRF